jgi:mycothiol synthase
VLLVPSANLFQTVRMTVKERLPETTAPALYMLWPYGRRLPVIPAIPIAYSLSMVVSEHIDNVRPLIEMDGPLSDSGWSRFRDAVVPDGMFVIQERPSSAWVGAISAVHNPAATRFYFPGGGELGYLVVAPEHRRRGLGAALITAALRRLRQGGYRHIFLGVQSWRLPAIRSYLRVGFQPLIHAPELLSRWESVFAALGQEAHNSEWPTKLVGPTAPIDLL